MDMKRKLEIMKHIQQANQRHLDEWKEKQTMNPNTAFIAEQKARITEVSDLLIVIQAGITAGNVAPQTAGNSIGIAVDALQGIAAAMNSVTGLVRAADNE